MSSPRVSILIAAYNPRFLRAALNSVAAQTEQDVEVVIRDDSRGDAVATVVEAFTAQSSLRVDYQRNETQLGVRRNYERCFADARGEYVKFLNDDDLLDPTCLELLARVLDATPAAHLATSHRRRVDERGSPLRDSPATVPVVAVDSLVDGDSLINGLLLLGLNFVGEPSTAMLRRSAIAAGEPLFDFLGDPGRGVSDVVLWCKLAQRGPVAFLVSRLSSFRIHGEQRQSLDGVQSLGVNSIRSMREKWMQLDGHLDIPPNVLRTVPLPAGTAAQWRHTAIPAFTEPGSDIEQLVADWRARRHPFFTAPSES